MAALLRVLPLVLKLLELLLLCCELVLCLFALSHGLSGGSNRSGALGLQLYSLLRRGRHRTLSLELLRLQSSARLDQGSVAKTGYFNAY